MDQVTLVKNQYRLEQWIKLIQDRQSSGLKVDDWCKANGVTRHAYYYWLRKVRQAACRDLPIVSAANTPITFKKLSVQAPIVNSQTAVVIHLSGATLEVANGVSKETMEAVLLALKTTC